MRRLLERYLSEDTLEPSLRMDELAGWTDGCAPTDLEAFGQAARDLAESRQPGISLEAGHPTKPFVWSRLDFEPALDALHKKPVG